jgi:DNA primase
VTKGRISPEFIQKIKDAVNLIDVVGEHVVLKKSGSNFMGLCPFHNERSPSFAVSETKQLYSCHGCKKGGDLVTFTQEIHGLSFVEAVEELAERAKLALPADFTRGDETDPETAKRREAAREKLATAYKLNRFTASFFRNQLEKGKANAHIAGYFRKRGVSPALSQSFYIGAAPAAWDALASHLVKAKAPLPLAAELGLIKPSQKGTKTGPGYFDLFRNRAMFPILDLRGKVVGFGGRGLPTPSGAPDVGGESPKYLNSSESLLFQKSKLAYGMFQAQKHIREKDEVILVEGYFDVLALHAGGFQNAVATCGTSLTEDHLVLFRKFCSKVTVLFDGDKAGIAATDRAMELGLKLGAILHGASLPDGLDPDEILFDQDTGTLIPDGIERMKGILAKTAPLFDARIESARVFALKGTEARSKAIKQVAEWLAMYRDPVGRELRVETVARDFGISKALLQTAMSGAKTLSKAAPGARSAGPTPLLAAGPGDRSGSRDPARGKTALSQKPSLKEVILIRGLLRGGNYRMMIEEARGYLPEGRELFELADHASVRKVLEAILDRGMTPETFLESVASAPEPSSEEGSAFAPEIRDLVTESLVGTDAPGEAPLSEGEFRIAVQRGIHQSWARFSQELKGRLRDAELKKDEDLRSRLAQEFLDVKRRMKEFESFYDEV